MVLLSGLSGMEKELKIGDLYNIEYRVVGANFKFGRSVLRKVVNLSVNHYVVKYLTLTVRNVRIMNV